jgi:hypothetical protein
MNPENPRIPVLVYSLIQEESTITRTVAMPQVFQLVLFGYVCEWIQIHRLPERVLIACTCTDQTSRYVYCQDDCGCWYVLVYPLVPHSERTIRILLGVVQPPSEQEQVLMMCRRLVLCSGFIDATELLTVAKVCLSAYGVCRQRPVVEEAMRRFFPVEYEELEWFLRGHHSAFVNLTHGYPAHTGCPFPTEAGLREHNALCEKMAAVIRDSSIAKAKIANTNDWTSNECSTCGYELDPLKQYYGSAVDFFRWNYEDLRHIDPTVYGEIEELRDQKPEQDGQEAGQQMEELVTWATGKRVRHRIRKDSKGHKGRL